MWITSQATGSDSGTGFLGNTPTGKSFSTPPQACSIKFNEDGLVVKYTIGHVMERSMGNTGGLGASSGPRHREAVPSLRPTWKPSKRYRALMLVGRSAWLKGESEHKNNNTGFAFRSALREGARSHATRA